MATPHAVSRADEDAQATRTGNPPVSPPAHLAKVDAVQIWQAVEAGVARVNAAVEHDCLTPAQSCGETTVFPMFCTCKHIVSCIRERTGDADGMVH
eukprot:350937-Chlamydomonas_euryale.AAC.3